MMAQVLLRTGYWPPSVPFETKELFTVIHEINQQEEAAARAYQR